MCQAIVLAAGYSSRAKTNKLILDYKGLPILTNLVMTLLQVCEDVIVVTGHYHDEVVSLVKDLERVEVIYNQNYDRGMFSSVQKGLAAITSDFFVIPGDCPIVKIETCELLLEAEGVIAVPVYEGRKGHPIRIRASLIEALRNEPNDSNLKHFRDKHPVTLVSVTDQGVLIDVDTMKDYELLLTEGGKVHEDQRLQETNNQ